MPRPKKYKTKGDFYRRKFRDGNRVLVWPKFESQKKEYNYWVGKNVLVIGHRVKGDYESQSQYKVRDSDGRERWINSDALVPITVEKEIPSAGKVSLMDFTPNQIGGLDYKYLDREGKIHILETKEDGTSQVPPRTTSIRRW